MEWWGNRAILNYLYSEPADIKKLARVCIPTIIGSYLQDAVPGELVGFEWFARVG